MRKTTLLITIAMIGLFVIPALVSSAPVIGTTNPINTNREQVMNVTGYGFTKNSYNPFVGNPNYLCTFMYEALFANINSKANANERLVPCIGTTMVWAADGMSVLVTLNPAAKWSDGSAITPADVVFSYQCHAASRYTTLVGTAPGDIYADVVAVGTNQVNFTVNSANSYKAFLFLTMEISILPKKVLQSVLFRLTGDVVPADFTDPLVVNWKNDWFDAVDTLANETICSGPYKPYYRSADGKTEVGVRRDDWWGINTLYMTKIPNYSGSPDVKYISAVDEADNNLKILLTIAGQIDCMAGAVTNMNGLLKQVPTLQTYYGKSDTKFSRPLGGLIGIALNQQRFPFTEPWFAHVIALSSNYTDVNNRANAGMWVKQKSIILNPDVPNMAPYYSAALDAAHEYTVYDVAEATAIYEANTIDIAGVRCATVPDAAVDNGILAPDGTPLDYTHDYDNVTTAGIQIRIEGAGFICNTIQGWTDVADYASFTIAYANTVFGAGTIEDPYDNLLVWEGSFDIAMTNDNYQMTMFCLGPQLQDDMVTVLDSFCNAATDKTQLAVTNWEDAAAYDTARGIAGYNEYKANVTAMDGNYVGNPAAFVANVEACGTILAERMPWVPGFCNLFFYIVNTYYWSNWHMESNNFIDPVNPAVNNKIVQKQMWVLSLKATGAVGPSTVPWSGFEIASVIGLISVVGFVLIKKRRNEQ